MTYNNNNNNHNNHNDNEEGKDNNEIAWRPSRLDQSTVLPSLLGK
jgi:hypothetical protein